jgi:hypothetical protein
MTLFIIVGDFSGYSDYTKTIAITDTYAKARQFVENLEEDDWYYEEGLYHVDVYEVEDDDGNGIIEIENRYKKYENLSKDLYKKRYEGGE